MATTTKQNTQYCTTAPSIDANIGPWASIDAYLAWLSSELGVDAPQEGTEILVKDNTGAMTKYRYEVISGTPTWTTPASEVAVDSALDTTSDNPVKNKVVAAAIANLQSAVDSAEDSAEDSAAAAAAASSSADRAAISAADASSSASRSTSLASQAAASATSANNSAAAAAQSLLVIQNALANLDPSTSTEDAIVTEAAARAAKDAELESTLGQLGPKIGDVNVNAKTVNYSDITMTLGAVTASTGANASSSNFYRTPFISIDGYEKVSFVAYKAYSSGHTFGCAFYSSDDVSAFISGSKATIDTSLSTYELKEYKLNIPSGAKYIRCSVYVDFRSQFKLVATSGSSLAERMTSAENDISSLNSSFPVLRQDVNNVSLPLKGTISIDYALKLAHGSSAIVTELELRAGVKYTITAEVSAVQSSTISIVLGSTTVAQIAAGETSKTGTYTSNSNQTLALKADFYATPTTGAVVTFTIAVDKVLMDEVSANTTAVTSLDAQLNGAKTTLKYTGAQWKEYTFEKGKSYFVTNQGSSTVTFGLWAATTDSSSIQSTNISAGATKEIVAQENANYLKAGAATTALVVEKKSLSNDVAVLQNEVNELNAKTSETAIITLPVAPGYTRTLNYTFKQGGVYDVRIQTTSTGKQLVFYIGSVQIRKWTQFSGDETIRICSSLTDNMKINFSSLLEAGTTTVTIERINEAFAGSDFQFGVGINCRYEVPTQDAFVIPTSENRPNGFYSKFDALVTAYPTYVTKVDCDELANEADIETPSYMDGCPIYMYKFYPAFTPNASAAATTTTSRSILKVMIIGGTHPEYTSIMDLWRTMAIICENWASDPNLEALRWDVEFYVLPCEGAWCVKDGGRTNYNGVDLNRNMPTGNWAKTGAGTTQYSGDSAGSEYESKVLIEVFNQVKPHILIDHHNANSSIGKNMVYVTSLLQKGVDIGAAHISTMTARWKSRFSSIMPQDDTIFGFAQITSEAGTRAGWACEQGVLGFTYESNEQIYYASGSNTSTVATIATDGFLNFLLRVCKTYSEWSR